MVDFKKLGERIAIRQKGRNDAKELFSLVTVPQELSYEYAEAFIEQLTELLPKSPPKVKKTGDKIPVSRLGTTEIEFGKYKGKTFDDVPIEYLSWLQHEQESFHKHLRNYLNHPDLEQYRRGME